MKLSGITICVPSAVPMPVTIYSCLPGTARYSSPTVAPSGMSGSEGFSPRIYPHTEHSPSFNACTPRASVTSSCPQTAICQCSVALYDHASENRCPVFGMLSSSFAPHAHERSRLPFSVHVGCCAIVQPLHSWLCCGVAAPFSSSQATKKDSTNSIERQTAKTLSPIRFFCRITLTLRFVIHISIPLPLEKSSKCAYKIKKS